jgi:hypothetical protein
MLGPGLVFMALAQGSGELIWWPYVISKYGLAFLFLLVPACLLQFPLTFEIGRYTVLTGEGVFRGFFRLHKGFGWLLWILFTVSFFWFGAFASAGGTAIAKLTGFPGGLSQRGQSLLWAEVSIVVFTVALLCSKGAYRMIEWIMKIVALVSLFGMVVACSHPTVRAVLFDFLGGLVVPDVARMRTFDAADSSRLLTAITFAGLGGFWTLFYSYWIKEKGVGMAALRAPGAILPADEPDAKATLRSWYRSCRSSRSSGSWAIWRRPS